MAKSILKLLSILLVNALVAIIVVLYMHIGTDMYPGHQELLARKCVTAGKEKQLMADRPTWINWFIVKRNARYADVAVSAKVENERYRFTCLFEDEHLESRTQENDDISWTVQLIQFMSFNELSAKVKLVHVALEPSL
jgi:hypothetical protein